MKGRDLITVLDEAVDKHLHYLVADFGGRNERGMAAFSEWPGPRSIKPVVSGQFPDLFLYVNRFLFADMILDISYGDRELILEPTLFYNLKKPVRIRPSELLRAAGVEDDAVKHDISGAWFVYTPKSIISTVERLAKRIKQCWGVIRHPDSETIHRALWLRGQDMAMAMAEDRRRLRETACAKAGDSFHAGRLAEAIRLLEPFEHDSDLPPSSAKLLALARIRVAGKRRLS